MRFNLPRRAIGRSPIYAPRKYTEVLDVLWEAGAALTTHEIADVMCGAPQDLAAGLLVAGQLRSDPLHCADILQRSKPAVDHAANHCDSRVRITPAGLDARQWSAS